MPANSANDKPIVVVTGASGGIGSAIAKVIYDRAGDEVRLVLHANSNGAALAGLATELGQAEVIQANLASDQDRQRFVVEVLAAGEVCGLINAAGIDKPRETALDISDEAIDLIMGVNFKAALCLMRDLGRAMARGDGGVIINVSSVLAHMSLTGSAVYRASKAALEAATKQFARELGPRGVRVNAIQPGFVATNMTADLSDSLKEKVAGQMTASEFGQPEEMAEATWALLDNDYINGAILTVDGGLTA